MGSLRVCECLSELAGRQALTFGVEGAVDCGFMVRTDGLPLVWGVHPSIRRIGEGDWREGVRELSGERGSTSRAEMIRLQARDASEVRESGLIPGRMQSSCVSGSRPAVVCANG